MTKLTIKHKKSQVTMLMIIGLVLFIVVSFVFYFSKSGIKKQSQQSIKKTQQASIETQPVKEFVSQCLDKLAKDAFVLLGSQGGYIYKSQGGNLVDYSDTDEGSFFVNHNNHKAAYNIFPPRFIPNPPVYPWETFPYETKDSNEQIFEWYFGINGMPPLTPSGGPNSIQSQIESFIDSNMPKCADFSFFGKQGLEVSMNSTKTSVVIASSDVSIRSKIPIRMTNPKTNEIAEIDDFSTSLNIRVKDIYYFIRALIDADVKGIRFNISDIKNEKDSFKVRIFKDIISKDDLIMVTDEKSVIRGSKFEYIFARRNRIPALHYIKNTDNLQFEAGHNITEDDILSGQELRAEEPDEDDYVIKITPLPPCTSFPCTLIVPHQKFKVEVNDSVLLDYQIINVTRV